MKWNYHNPVKIIAGVGSRYKLGSDNMGKLLLLTTKGMINRGVTTDLTKFYKSSEWHLHTIAPNPELEMLEELTKNLRHQNFNTIIALGGGSVMDAAKVISVLIQAEDILFT